MTSNALAIDILVCALKHYRIRHLVLSPGTRNIPFVTAVESDLFFVCHSVVDERSAAFFAMGLAQELGESVGLSCTSGTAASNYLSGMTEAFFSHVPVLAITADRSPYVLHQLETQKIDQPAVFASVTKKSANLPVLKDADDVWHFSRLLGEALIELRRHRPGPVHVNLPLVGDTNAMWNTDGKEGNAVNYRFVDSIWNDDNRTWSRFAKRLEKARRILVVVGACDRWMASEKRALSDFCKKFRAPVLGDHFANVRPETFVMAEAVCKGLTTKTFAEVLPDIVITLGTNFQERIKDLFKAHRGEFEHWSIDPEGVVRDVFKSQTAVFECSVETFFDRMSGLFTGKREDGYLKLWKRLEKAAVLPPLPYGQFYAIGALARAIPAGSLVHLSVLNAMRLMQFFPLADGVRVAGNVNAFGIDGCLPTFLGQALAGGRRAFLVIGDLSFFYGMNALAIRERAKDVRIFLVNNRGAAEFHIPPASHSLPMVDQHIGCRHGRTAKAWAEDCGFKYLSASDEKSLSAALPEFAGGPESAVLLEVFTDMAEDGPFCLSVYRDLEKKVSAVLAEESKP